MFEAPIPQSSSSSIRLKAVGGIPLLPPRKQSTTRTTTTRTIGDAASGINNRYPASSLTTDTDNRQLALMPSLQTSDKPIRHPASSLTLALATLLALLSLCRVSMAAENPPGSVEIEFDASRCTVQFTLGAVLHTVHGSFKVKGGHVSFDPGSGQASGQIVVDVRSGETGDSGRDRQMHEAVLESNRFPEAAFSLDRVKGQFPSSGESQITLHGSLRLHGGEHEMTIPATVKEQNDLVTANARFTVPYVEWGMKDPSNLVLRVDKTVKVEVTFTGKVAAHSGATAPTRR
jgi:polyisoprenoid-binding protein YceI